MRGLSLKVTRTNWGMRFDYCFRCGQIRNLETHEMLRGIYRQKAVKLPCCWLRFCNRCHQGLIHKQPEVWTYPKQLAIKAIHDPAHYDRQLCNDIFRNDQDFVTEREVMVEANLMLCRHEIYLPQL